MCEDAAISSAAASQEARLVQHAEGSWLVEHVKMSVWRARLTIGWQSLSATHPEVGIQLGVPRG